MRPLFAISAAALLWSAVTAFAGELTGHYSVQGTNPGSTSRYGGTVSVEKTGQTYRVIWIVAGQRYIGTGIGNGEFVAVSYVSGRETGLALYAPNGDNWSGVWTFANGRQMGTEVWKRE
jgi:hypothetical protein